MAAHATRKRLLRQQQNNKGMSSNAQTHHVDSQHPVVELFEGCLSERCLLCARDANRTVP